MTNEPRQPLYINGFRFDQLIGEGTYSKAFKVYSVQYQKFFCAKVTEVDDDFFDEYGNPRDPELFALISLDNPNVIKVYKYFRDRDLFFLILEYCECGTLMDRLNSKVPLDILSIFTIMKDILTALIECHHLKIAHRDIKPSNIFIDSFGHAKIADFGLSTILPPSQNTCNIACGSPAYAAPEIYGEKGFDPFKADVFSLGVTLYQMVFNRLPWPDEVTINSMNRPPLEYPPDCDPYLVELLSKMLSINPADRPSMIEVMHCDFFHHIEEMNSRDRDDPFDPKKTENSIRASISLRDGHARKDFAPGINLCPNIPGSISASKGRITCCAYSRIKALNPAMDRSRRGSAKMYRKPSLTFNDM